MDYKEALDWLSCEVARYKEKRPFGSRKHLVMELIDAVSELTDMLRSDVLERVTREVVLDADVNIDFSEAATQVLELQLDQQPVQVRATGADSLAQQQQGADDTDIVAFVRSTANSVTLNQLIARWNAALEKLTDVLSQIADMLVRPRKDEDYAALYNKEKTQFNSSSTYRQERKNFKAWLYNDSGGHPSPEDIDDYCLGRLIHLFETGIFDVKISRRQRFKKYPDEIDFEQMDNTNKMKPVMYKHYAELRRMVDYVDGDLVPNPARVGCFFYDTRKEKNAKVHRVSFMKYMMKISLAQEVRHQQQQQALSASPVKTAPQLNYFAPEKNLKELLRGTWFSELCSDKKYDAAWTDGFVSALMASEWREAIAQEWSAKGTRNKRTQIKGYVVGQLKDSGVLKGSYDSIARKVGATDDFRVFSRYMGKGKRQPYAKWVDCYVHRES